MSACYSLLFSRIKRNGGILVEVVLMRHGKAEPRSNAKADFERELTSIGRKKTKQAARGLANCLYIGRDIQIWTSPAMRAVQTAEILREGFGKKVKVAVIDALADGRLEDLQSEWSKIPALDVLIVVGHEPMISEWTAKMSNAALVFGPASAASILLENAELNVGSLAWFMRAGVMAQLCPPSVSQRRQRT